MYVKEIRAHDYTVQYAFRNVYDVIAMMNEQQA